MFRRDKAPKATPTSAIDQYQTASDQKSEAHEFFLDTWRTLQLAEEHPWHTSNEQLIGMAEAAIAYTNDRLAEILQATAGKTDVHGNTTLTTDVYDFALTLTENARRNIAAARNYDQQGSPRTLNPDTIVNLNPEAMLPYWPQEPATNWQERPDWQGVQTAPVTQDFVCGILAATRELQGDIYHYLGEYEAIRVAETPAEYTHLGAVIKDYLIQPTLERLDAAEALLMINRLSPESLATAYRDVHDSYIATARAFTAIFCPAVLGNGTPEGGWLPERH